MKSEQSFAGLDRNITPIFVSYFSFQFTRNRKWIRSLWLTGISKIGFDSG